MRDAIKEAKQCMAKARADYERESRIIRRLAIAWVFGLIGIIAISVYRIMEG